MSIYLSASLENEKKAAEALAAVVALEVPNRTAWMVYDNKTTYWNAKLVLMQAINEYYEVPEGYQRDTGVTVGGVNVTGPSAQRTPIQQGINVTGTRAKCSAQLVGRNGEEQTFHHPDLVAEQGKYWVTMAFGIQPAGVAAEVAFVAATDNEGKLHSFEVPLSKRA